MYKGKKMSKMLTTFLVLVWAFGFWGGCENGNGGFSWWCLVIPVETVGNCRVLGDKSGRCRRRLGVKHLGRHSRFFSPCELCGRIKNAAKLPEQAT